MRKTLYLHIGHFKTGTTAIQVMMAHNMHLMRRAGLHYAESWLEDAKHSALALSIYREIGVTDLMHGYNDDASPQSVWDALFDEVRGAGCSVVLASTEELMRIGALPDAEAVLRDIITPVQDEFDIRIIAYFRSPQAHLVSWYNQMIKMNASPLGRFDVAVSQMMEPIHYDYGQALRPWLELFGPGAVTVKRYTDDLREGYALYDDFLDIMDMSRPFRLKLPEEDVNPRLDPNLLEATRMLQMAGFFGEDLEWAQAKMSRIRDMVPHDEVPFDTVVTRARAGVKAMQRTAAGFDDFLDDLPQPHGALDPHEVVDLLIYLLNDVTNLRNNVHQKLATLTERLAAVEAQVQTADKEPH